ncbi:MAG: DUF4124 domain-containing protein [Ectothiorhodospiraceae bacterium]|jgi:hypothetical protein
MFLTATAASAEFYRWTDAQGRVHYSDEPHPGAERIDPGQPSVYKAPPTPTSQAAGEAGSKPAADSYREFEVVAPGSKDTINSAPGNMTVQLKLSPALRKGDRIRILMDDKPLTTTTSTTVGLSNVDRGTHTLAAEVIDGRGQVVARTGNVTFFLHRPSVNLPTRQSGGN